MFECVRKNRRRDVLAYGGRWVLSSRRIDGNEQELRLTRYSRYDALLEHFEGARSYNAPTYGVGMSISVEYVEFS